MYQGFLVADVGLLPLVTGELGEKYLDLPRMSCCCSPGNALDRSWLSSDRLLRDSLKLGVINYSKCGLNRMAE